MYIDSHAHLTSPELKDDVDQLLKRAHLAGVHKIINICTDILSLEQGIDLAKRYDWVFNTAATTPHDVEKEGEEFFPIVAESAKRGELVAIGETGLDYYYEHSPKKLQQEHLCRYFSLAKKTDLPVIFHCREAFADLFALADTHYKGCPAVLHCFTGTLEEAKGVLDRGWFLSCSGIVTYKKSDALREVIRYVPLDRLFIETDMPFLAPQTKRGKPNESAFISETAAMVAHIKGVSLESVAQATSANAERFFFSA